MRSQQKSRAAQNCMISHLDESSMAQEGGTISFDLANKDASGKAIHWRIREITGNIHWLDFSEISPTYDWWTDISGATYVEGKSSKQVTLKIRNDNLIEEPEVFDIIAADKEISYDDGSNLPSIATFTIEDSTPRELSSSISAQYEKVTSYLQDSDLPGGGTLSADLIGLTFWPWKNIFYVSHSTTIIERNAESTTGSIYELVVRNPNGKFSRKYSTNIVKPSPGANSLVTREATVDDKGNIYSIIEEYDINSSNTKTYRLVKHGNSGELTYSIKLGTTTDSFRHYQGIQIDGNGDVVVASYSEVNSYPTPQLDKYKGDTGLLAWSQKPFEKMEDGSVRISEKPIHILGDGSILIAASGHFGIGSPGVSSYIARLNGSDGITTNILGIDGDSTYFQNELFSKENSVFFRTVYGSYKVDVAGTGPLATLYPWDTQSTTSGEGLGSSTAGKDLLTLGDLGIDLSSAIAGTSPKNDKVKGTELDNVIMFGKGRDQLTGDRGADFFLFQTPDKFGIKTADLITDFLSTEGDKLVVTTAALPGLSNSIFKSVANKKALASSQRSGATFIYYQPLGQLYFDQNGTVNGYGSGGLFAVFSGSPELSSSDLVIIG